MSCSQVKSWVNWLLIGCLQVCSQLGARLLVDTTLDNDYLQLINFPPLGRGGRQAGLGGRGLGDEDVHGVEIGANLSQFLKPGGSGKTLLLNCQALSK